jgi:5-(carboxyamino)imidazole ribonucleotide synthase
MIKKFGEENFSLGILGGGQLGKMLIQQAINYNLQVNVLEPDKDAPCKNICNEFVNGSITDFDTVYNFGKQQDVLTIEIEHVNTEALLQLENEGIQIFPQPAILQLIQDKGLQKEFYKNNNIPSPDFYLINCKAEINNYSNEFPFFQKLRKGGYDGKGVCKIESENDLIDAFDAPSVLEKYVNFKKEISVIVARNSSGEIKTFPVVDCEFSPEANLVEFLYSPSAIGAETEKKAQQIAYNIAEKLKITGLLAVEMFVTHDDKVLVNEIAPRPHNSGHHTIEANFTSQFEQHLRAILNLPLGNTDMIMPAVMFNVLGEPGYQGFAKYEGLEQVLKTKGAHVHLYGKKITKPYRKMGHVTICNPHLDKAIDLAKKLKHILKVKA